jgi:hypothetical protein
VLCVCVMLRLWSLKGTSLDASADERSARRRCTRRGTGRRQRRPSAAAAAAAAARRTDARVACAYAAAYDAARVQDEAAVLGQVERAAAGRYVCCNLPSSQS